MASRKLQRSVSWSWLLTNTPTDIGCLCIVHGMIEDEVGHGIASNRIIVGMFVVYGSLWYSLILLG